MSRLLASTFALLLTGVSHAAAVSGQGTWENTLLARDMDGDISTIEAYYDTVQDITWLADANYAKTSGYDADGHMTWAEANAWANGLTLGGYTGWRLPNTVDVGNDGETYTNIYEGVDAGWNISSHSEMSHLFYETLGNYARFDTRGVANDCGISIDCLTNTGPFSNIQSRSEGVSYWSATEYEPWTASFAWMFVFFDGGQGARNRFNSRAAWAVHDGDIFGPDTDNDSTSDAVDNCPEVANEDQSDVDGDGIGDVCDPFPESDDHEFAQCEADFDSAVLEIDFLTQENQQLKSSLNRCQNDSQKKDQIIQNLNKENDQLRSLLDADADGVPDEVDVCPDTLPWQWNVLPNGCHKRQIVPAKRWFPFWWKNK